MEKFNRIVLNIPHSSDTFITKSDWQGDIDKAVDKWTDWHTDRLFNSLKPNIVALAFPFSRFECDVERLIDDEMEKIGQGIAYHSIEGCTRELSRARKKEIYKLYLSYLREFIKITNVPNTLVIDCHSFPSEIAPNIDICIGYNEDESKPSQDVLDLVKKHFEEFGYRVEFNNPYSNSRCVGNIPSLMIEINKRVYLQSDEKTPLADMYKVHHRINMLYDKLLNNN